MKMTKIPIAKTEEGKVLYIKMPKDPNTILVVNNFSRNKQFFNKRIGQLFVIEDPKEFE